MDAGGLRPARSHKPSGQWNRHEFNSLSREIASAARAGTRHANKEKHPMNSIIYIVGLVVVVLFILSFLGLR